MSEPGRLLRRFVFLTTWVVGFPSALAAIVIGVVLLGIDDPSGRASKPEPWVGWILVLAGLGATTAFLGWLRRMKRAADAVTALPQGDLYERIWLEGYGQYGGSQGAAGTWLDVGEGNLLIHDRLRYRGIVPLANVQAALRSRRWRTRLLLTFDPEATILEFGHPRAVERLELPPPAGSTARLTELLGAGAVADEGSESDLADIVKGLPVIVGVFLLAPWAGQAVGRGIAQRISEGTRPGGFPTFMLVAFLSWILAGALIWIGHKREWYDLDEAGAWLIVLSPIVAFVASIPVSFFVYA